VKEFTLDIERKWGEHKTTITVYGKDESNVLRVSTQLEDVVRSIKEEIGSVTWVFTKKEFERRLDLAFANVLKEMGKATIKVAGHIPIE
jgi:hypothetical protein